jgi:hypothetical protein
MGEMTSDRALSGAALFAMAVEGYDIAFLARAHDTSARHVKALIHDFLSTTFTVRSNAISIAKSDGRVWKSILSVRERAEVEAARRYLRAYCNRATEKDPNNGRTTQDDVQADSRPRKGYRAR